ncbi:MAG: hypothetical protein QOD92_2023 [Acidimicrobiaceae bacterium]|jgi:hypothetical protein
MDERTEPMAWQGVPADALSVEGAIEGIGAFGRAAGRGTTSLHRGARWFFWATLVIPFLLVVGLYAVTFALALLESAGVLSVLP